MVAQGSSYMTLIHQRAWDAAKSAVTRARTSVPWEITMSDRDGKRTFSKMIIGIGFSIWQFCTDEEV